MFADEGLAFAWTASALYPNPDRTLGKGAKRLFGKNVIRTVGKGAQRLRGVKVRRLV